MQVQTQVESDVAMDRRRHENRADAQLVLILEDKPDTVPYKQDHTLSLTPEFGPGVTPRARLTRVPQCADDDRELLSEIIGKPYLARWGLKCWSGSVTAGRGGEEGNKLERAG
ncbi:hypothetical protein Tco_1556946 [Tanacetum coccineum]